MVFGGGFFPRLREFRENVRPFIPRLRLFFVLFLFLFFVVVVVVFVVF